MRVNRGEGGGRGKGASMSLMWLMQYPGKEEKKEIIKDLIPDPPKYMRQAAPFVSLLRVPPLYKERGQAGGERELHVKRLSL